MPATLPIIDSHAHFWDVERLDYAWLRAFPAIDRTFLPSDVDRGRHRLDGFVFVQADCADHQAMAEVDWVAGLASSVPVKAIVAHAPLERDTGVGQHLAALARHPLVTGVRRLIQGEPPGFATDASFVERVRSLATHDLTFDICVTHEQLTEAEQLVARCPDVLFILDHLGKPDVAGRRLDPWRAQITALAARPNVMAKLSGLATEADPEHWTSSDVAPFLRHALSEFGPARCLFGGDWPVATLATTYERWVDTVLAATSDLSDAERDQVFAGTARRVYRIDSGAGLTPGAPA